MNKPKWNKACDELDRVYTCSSIIVAVVPLYA